MTTEIALLARAHELFGGQPAGIAVDSGTGVVPGISQGSAGALSDGYRSAVANSRAVLDLAREADSELAAILAAVRRDHQQAREDTGAVLAAARRDSGLVEHNPIAAREALRRRHLRLRAQRAHVLAARRRARRRQRALRALRYLAAAGPAGRTGGTRAQAAVRAALSRLGCPYVWGAAGPDRFDCSGLVKWAYAQAGVPLHRTTYDQINDGIAVPRSQIQPGDLVFPHAGHVQLAIGNNRVVEAPYPGATVQVSPLGDCIAIRRPRF